MFDKAERFAKAVIPGIIKPLRALWNEMIGFVFLVFAVFAAGSVFRAWRSFDGSGDSIVRMILSGFFALMMGFFGVTSFLRARKISRS
jgi:glycerol uptake facilitator-like aquaporin